MSSAKTATQVGYRGRGGYPNCPLCRKSLAYTVPGKLLKAASSAAWGDLIDSSKAYKRHCIARRQQKAS